MSISSTCDFVAIARPVNVGQKANFGVCSIINPTFIGFEETSSRWSVQFFSYIWVVNLKDRTVRAGHSCNSWVISTVDYIRPVYCVCGYFLAVLLQRAVIAGCLDSD